MTKRTPSPSMPPRAAAYLEVVSVRERIFTMMFERTGNVKRAVDDAYIAMAFIEDGDASVDQEAGRDETAADRTPVGVPESEQPAGEVSDTRPTAVVQPEATDPRELEFVHIGHKQYTHEQIDRFKALWNSPDSTVEEISASIGSTWPTAQRVADRIGLGMRAKKRGPSGTHSAAGRAAGAISLDQAIDWFEAQDGGKPVIPAAKFPGSYQLGEDTGAVITRNALVAEINALRLRMGEDAFTIQFNGA